MNPSVILYQHEEARSRICDPSFVTAWDALRGQCPWATAFQGPDFVNTWFDAYRHAYSPVVTCRRGPDGELLGLLVLAQRMGDGQLVAPGAEQAEYQCWLAPSSDDHDFIAAALSTVRESFPARTLTFEYLPSRLPVKSLMTIPPLRGCSSLRAFRRPLMRLDRRLEQSLRKRSNKSRLNRLRRGGELRFQRVRDREALEAVFDQVIAFYDTRQGAVHDSMPFSEDPAKKEFYLAMLEMPELLHVTTLTVGGKVVAAHLGVQEKDCVYVGIPAHSPQLARHSPGKLHMLLLGRHLLEERISLLDLTPGGDPYKDRFANDEETVYGLTWHDGRAARVRAAVRAGIGSIARRAAERAGLTPDEVRLAARAVSMANLRTIPGRVRESLRMNEGLCVYRRTSDSLALPDLGAEAARDELSHLMQFSDERTRQQFLATALRRLEEGHHVYTIVRDGKLVHHAWLCEGQAHSCLPEAHQRFGYPDGSAVFYDLFTDVDAVGKAFHERTLRQMLDDLRAVPNVRRVYVTARTDDIVLRHAIEKAGFSFDCSLGPGR